MQLNLPVKSLRSEFMTMNGIHHIRSASYHPATNGLAEHAVQTLKESLKKIAPGSLQATILFSPQYRIAPHTSYYWCFTC